MPLLSSLYSRGAKGLSACPLAITVHGYSTSPIAVPMPAVLWTHEQRLVSDQHLCRLFIPRSCPP